MNRSSMAAIGLVLALALTVRAQDEKPKVGFLVSVGNPITDQVRNRVRNQADDFIRNSIRRGERPVLVFNIASGESDYGNCYELATYITSLAGQAQTVAFVPQPLHGHAVLVALACERIVLAPTANIGDIGLNRPRVRDSERAGYIEILHRTGRSAFDDLVVAMLDKNTELMEATMGAGGKRDVLPEHLAKLRRDQAVIETQQIKNRGVPYILTAAQARQKGLVDVTAKTPGELIDLFNLKSLSEDPTLGQELRAVKIKIDGPIDTANKEYLMRRVKRALEEKKNLIIFEIDSSGGDLITSFEMAEFIDGLRKDGVLTVAYVPHQALSGASFIALGCQQIVVKKGSQLGDAGAIRADGPNGEWQYVPEKLLTAAEIKLRTLAEDNHYPPTLAAALMSKDMVVYQVRNRETQAIGYMTENELRMPENAAWRKDREEPVKEKGRFLIMPTAQGLTARDLGFAREIVDNDERLAEIYGLDNSEIPVEGPNWVDDLVTFLNNSTVKMLLLVIATVALWLELKMPGVTLPGVISALCFLLFFWSQFMGGTGKSLDVLLFAAGLLCLGIEVFLLPSGVFAVSGIGLILFSIILAQQTFILPHTQAEVAQLRNSLMTLTIAIISAVTVGLTIGRYFPSMPLFSRMVLAPQAPGDDAAGLIDPSALMSGGYAHLVGTLGIAASVLRPAGKARFGELYLDVVAEGSFIEPGTPVEVVEARGSRIVVKKAS